MVSNCLWHNSERYKNTKQKSTQACIKTHHFDIKNAKFFWDIPSPDPTHLGAYGASMALKLNVTPPPKKNHSYDLAHERRSLYNPQFISVLSTFQLDGAS